MSILVLALSNVEVQQNCDFQKIYGYTVMFNINICHNNLDDVKELTEIAHDNGIATDYHINETPVGG